MTSGFIKALTATSLFNVVASFNSCRLLRRYVHLRGTVSLRAYPKQRRGQLSPSSTHSVGERPKNPAALTSKKYLEENVEKVSDCLT